MRLPRRLLFGLVLVAGGALVTIIRSDNAPPPAMTFELPRSMTIEDHVQHLLHSVSLDRAEGSSVQLGRLEPGLARGINAPHRRAIIAAPPARLRFSAHVPPAAALRFGVGVEMANHGAASGRGVRFAIEIEKREVFARTVNPAATPGERRWFDARIDLGEWADKTVAIVLKTDADGAGTEPAGVAGWSHVRIVRERASSRQRAGPTTPSVLVLLVDTLRADVLGIYGASPSPSPMLDRLAEGGLVFDDFIAQAPWTLPSVASLFTGLHPRSHGVYGHPRDVVEGSGTDHFYLSEELQTLASAAQAAGITTVGVSGSPLVSRGTNLARGFESFVEFGWDRTVSRWPRARELNAVLLDWLAKNRDHRFFGYVHYMDAHEPYNPPRAYRPMAPPDVRPYVAQGRVRKILRAEAAGEGEVTATELAYLRELYAAEIRYWDHELGRLYTGIDELGLLDRMVIVVTSDHGEAFREHGHLGHGEQLYDELVRVPLVVSGPGVPPGRIPVQAQAIDLFPTVATLLDMRIAETTAGQNLLAAPAERPAVSELTEGQGAAGSFTKSIAVRVGSWKLVREPAAGQFELYDLAQDPGERRNRYGSAPEGPRLARYLSEWEASMPAPPPVSGSDPELGERLRALGYIE